MRCFLPWVVASTLLGPAAVSPEAIRPEGLCGGAPARFEQSADTTLGSLHIVFSTDRVSYGLGDPVWMRLEITNVGADSIAISSAWSPMELFEVYPDTCASANCAETWVYPPVLNLMVGDSIPLAPQKTQTRCATWNGVDSQADTVVAPGRFRIVGGFTSVSPSHSIYGFVYPPEGLTLWIDYGTGSVPAWKTSWGRIKSHWFSRG
jgi:hypothetical protein